MNHFDCEEFFDAEQSLTRALDKFEALPKKFTDGAYLDTLQDLCNHLGITHCNRGSYEKGLPFLEKA